MSTYESASKQRTLTICGINTYTKRGEGPPSLAATLKSRTTVFAALARYTTRVCDLLPTSSIPSDGLPQSVLQGGFSPPPEFGQRPRSIQAPPGLPVRLGSIPTHPTLVPRQRANQFQQVAHADLFARPQVNELRLFVLLRR